MSLKKAQEITLIAAVFFSATLSVLGSSCIVYIVLSKRKYVNTYNRLILAMSCIDVINSIFLPLQAILVPSSSDRLLASGNDATCSALGFFLQLGFAVAFYNGMLSWYYLLTVRLGVGQERVARRYEPFMHVIAIGWNLAAAVTGLALGAYGELELGFGCWISDYPKGCEADPDLSCSSDTIGWIFTGLPILVIMAFVAASNLMIYCKLRKLEVRMLRYSAGRRPEDRNKRTRAVAVQGFLYVAAFFNSFIWAVILRAVESNSVKREDEGDLFPLLLLTNLFLPLQGFWNMFIYARPRYRRIREQSIGETRLRVLWIALFEDGVAHERSAGETSRTTTIRVFNEAGSSKARTRSATTAGDGLAGDVPDSNQDVVVQVQVVPV